MQSNDFPNLKVSGIEASKLFFTIFSRVWGPVSFALLWGADTSGVLS